jgi:hypothetical protein
MSILLIRPNHNSRRNKETRHSRVSAAISQVFQAFPIKKHLPRMEGENENKHMKNRLAANNGQKKRGSTGTAQLPPKEDGGVLILPFSNMSIF